MQDSKTVCSGYRAGSSECAHGFQQSPPCWTGRPIGATDEGFVFPFCMNERLCAITFSNTGGKPRQPEGA